MDGKTVLITGASRGIGAAAAIEFANAGANVALLARSEDDIAELAGKIGKQALAIPCNISRYWEFEAAVEATIKTFGRLDVLIGNAGIVGPVGNMWEIDPLEWSNTADINLTGIFNGMRAVMPGMIAQGSGTILTLSSGAAHNPVAGWTAYCSAKAGAYMLTQVADKEVRNKGLRVLGLSPGTVATQMQREIKASGVGPVAKLNWSDHIPPEWPAKTLVWMCTSDADEFLGTDVSLRDEAIRKRVGLI